MLIAAAVLAAGGLVSLTLKSTINSADVQFQGSARVINRDHELTKKVDELRREMKRDMRQLIDSKRS